MKTWLKVYVICAIFIILIVNGGMLCVNYISYNSYIRHEIETAENDFESLAYNLKKDFEYIEREGYDANKYVNLILDMYRDRYKDNKDVNMRLAEQEDGYTQETFVRMYGNLFYGRSYIKSDKDTYMFEYTKSMTDMEDYWKGVFDASLIVTSAVVILFGIALYLILRRQFEPLMELGDVAVRMSEGKRGIRVKIKGNGDIATLCDRFNRMADALEAEVRAKQKFVDDLSHEMRTPMTSIRGYGERLMFEDSIPNDDKGAIEYIIHESDRMLHLSHELLDMAYVRNTDFEMEEINSDEFTGIVREGVASLCEKKGVKFNVLQSGEKIYGSKVLLTSAVVNITENAIKACDRGDEENDGSGVVDLKVYYKDDKCCISVKDNGIGIADKDIERILEPFYRVDKARSRKDGGVGLGLTLSMEIVRLHGGDINIYSEPGKGTEVIIALKKEEKKKNEEKIKSE